MKPVYRRMLDGMQKKAKARSSSSEEDTWFLYIVECNDGKFYTGITKDLSRRLKEHNDGKASRFTRTRTPVRLRYRETCSGRTEALVRECEVKAMSRKAKEKLIEDMSEQ